MLIPTVKQKSGFHIYTMCGESIVTVKNKCCVFNGNIRFMIDCAQEGGFNKVSICMNAVFFVPVWTKYCKSCWTDFIKIFTKSDLKPELEWKS